MGGLLSGIMSSGGGLLKKTVGLAARNPMKALGVGMIVAPTVMAASSAYKGGMQPGEKGRYLAAGRDGSGRIRASDAAYTNYHELFDHKPTPKQVRALSKNHKPEMFNRVKHALTPTGPKEK